MPYILKINTTGDFIKATKALNRLRTTLPQMEREAMREWGKMLEKDIKASARSALISDFTGHLQGRGIRYEQAKMGNTGRLFMAMYGIYLDSMRPHYVNLRSSRSRFVSWGTQAREAHIRKAAYRIQIGREKKYGIYVQPHPFIRQGYKRARPKLNTIIRKYTKRGLDQTLGGKNV